MAAAPMDFRFRWCWLLPVVPGGRMRLFGYTKDEVADWRKAMPALELNESNSVRAEVLLVDGTRCEQEIMPLLRGIEDAQVVSMVLTRAQAGYWRRVLRSTFAETREYGLLPSSNPRVVVPLSSARHAISGLSLHRPGRRIARLGVMVAKILAALGNFTLLRGRVLLIATRSQDFVPNGAAHAKSPAHMRFFPKDYALYLGNPNDSPKTVVLPVGDSPPNVILKVALTSTARAALDNEASVLRALAQSPLAELVPKLVGMTTSAGAKTLYQEYRLLQSVVQCRLDAAVVAFLGRLAYLDRKRVPLADWLKVLPSGSSADVSAKVDTACSALCARLQDMGMSGVEIWLHRTHGDFAPWNCAWTDKGLFVFDWEESRGQDLALGDAFYYVIAPALYIQRTADPAKILVTCLRLAKRVAVASGIELDGRVYLALWLLSRVGCAALYRNLIVLLERSWREVED